MTSVPTVQEYTQLKGEAGSLLADLGTSLITLVEAPTVDEEAAEAHRAIDEQLQSYWGRFYQLKKRHERSTLSVAVLALTKSGKSTLINALLGNEVLPVNNVPETARISRITHSPSSSCPEPVLEIKASLSPATSIDTHDLTRVSSGASSSNGSNGGTDNTMTVLTGAQQIREHLQQLNRDVRSREHLRNDDQALDITAPLMVLDGSATQDYSGIRMCLLDTPGPNEAGEEGLKYQVERLLDRVDAAIYLLDYTKLKTAEEAQVLERLKSINPSLVSRLCSRLFFAVNKMDQADESIGLDDEETKEYVAEMVTRQLNCPNFKLHPDQVLLLSARNALLSRLILAGRADPANMQRFSRIAFGSFNPRSTTGRSMELVRTAAEDMLQGSGVPELEERVVGFLFEAAAGVKLVAILDDMGRLLTEVSNVASSCRAALAASSARLTASSNALQQELSTTLSQFDCVMEGTTDLQLEVVDELRAHLGNLRTRLFQFICSSLDIEAVHQDPTAAASAANASGAAEAGTAGSSSSNHHNRRHHRSGCCHARHRYHRRQQQQDAFSSAAASCATAAAFDAEYDDNSAYSDPEMAAAAGDGAAAGVAAAAAAAASAAAAGNGRGWWRLRQRFLRMFGRWLGSSSGCDSKDELSSALMDLSEEIMAQIQSEVGDTWAVMERATNARAGRLVNSLNNAIEGLSARLEGVVNEGLQICLEPVSLRMQPPDAVTFHADLTELIEKGIAAEQARHVRACERTDMVWEQRRGACRLTHYYVQVPRRRRIVETYTATTYSLVPSAIAEHFMSVVDKAISETERHLAGYVKEYVRRQVVVARGRVKDYGDRYLDSMGAALDAASKGADARAAALAQVEAYCATLDSLRARQVQLQSRAELLVPHNSGSGCGVFEPVEYDLSDEENEQQQHDDDDAEQQQPGQTGCVEQPVGQAETAPDMADADKQMQFEAEEAPGGDVASSSSAAAVAGASGVHLEAVVTDDDDRSTTDAELAKQQEDRQELLQLLTTYLERRQQELQQDDAVDAQSERSAIAEYTDATAGTVNSEQAVEELRDNEEGGEQGALSADEQQDETVVATAFGNTEQAAVLFKSLSRADSSASSTGSSSSSSAQLLTAAEVQEAQQAEAAAAGVLLMASLPQMQLEQEQQEQEVESHITLNDATEAMSEADTTVAAAAVEDVMIKADEQAEEQTDNAAAAVTADAIVGALPAAADAAEAAAIPASRDKPVPADVNTPAAVDSGEEYLLDIDAIEGAQLLSDSTDEGATVAPTAVSPVPPPTLLPAVTVEQPAAVPASTAAAAEEAASPTSSGVSNAETAVSDAYSALSDAHTDSTAFSGMTAGTGFTLGSRNTQASGVSRVQEQLADKVLGRSGLMLSLEVPESASTAQSSEADTAGDHALAPAAAAVPLSGSESQMLHGSSVLSSDSNSIRGSVHAASGSAEQLPLDTSLYASIIAQSDDSPTAGDGSPSGNSPYDFQQSFAAALSAAGLDTLTGPLPPSEDSNSEDWLIVDDDVTDDKQ